MNTSKQQNGSSSPEMGGKAPEKKKYSIVMMKGGKLLPKTTLPDGETVSLLPPDEPNEKMGEQKTASQTTEPDKRIRVTKGKQRTQKLMKVLRTAKDTIIISEIGRDGKPILKEVNIHDHLKGHQQ